LTNLLGEPIGHMLCSGCQVGHGNGGGEEFFHVLGAILLVVGHKGGGVEAAGAHAHVVNVGLPGVALEVWEGDALCAREVGVHVCGEVDVDIGNTPARVECLDDSNVISWGGEFRPIHFY